MAVFSYTAPKPDKYKGVFLTEEALQTAHPTATVGDEADVDAGEGEKAIRYHYDAQEGWVPGGAADLDYTYDDGTKYVKSRVRNSEDPTGGGPQLYAYYGTETTGADATLNVSSEETGSGVLFQSQAYKDGTEAASVIIETNTRPNDPEDTNAQITVRKNVNGVVTETIFEIRPDGLYLNGSPFTGGNTDLTTLPGYNATVMQTLMHPANGVVQWGNGGTSTPLPTPTAPGGMVITSNPDGTKNIDFTLATI